uniref:chromatin assembly factor 1 subunit A-like isoform X2 n=1 Tax=Osmia lignaria TaxID=473952 RepID=UPI0014791D03|nr:chromatin assembly factor 1 subunit A-like isoform X2 [Osmia lignaria]
MPAVPAVAEGAGQLEDLDEPPEPRVRGGSGRAGLMKPLVVLALPGMYLFYKYSQYRREQRELSRRRVTERELQHLHHKIDKLLTKLEENEPELASSQEDEYSMSGKSCILPQSASEYNMGTGVSVGVTGPGGRWVPGNVPASASLYSMASGSSSISGVSSVSSSSSSSASSTGSSNLGKPTRVRQPSGATLRRSQTQSMKMRIQEYQDPIQQVAEEEEVMRENRERRLPPIKEFQRDYRAGKASTRIRCAQKIVTQLETSPSPRGSTGVNNSTSSSSARSAAKRPQSAPKLSVVQEIQKSKKEKEREKEREKAEKARQKEEEKAEKSRQKEAKKLAKEEKKRAKKEAKARRKEAEEALLREEK